MNEPGAPVDEGEIMYVDGTRGMLQTKSKQALSFDVQECRGFVPADRNIVAIARIEGMWAFGLSLVSDGARKKYERPVVPAGRVEALMRATPDARSGPRLTAHVLRERMPAIS